MHTPTVIGGDCISVMKGMPDNSFDAIVTDPPYEIGFMGKGHDSTGVAFDVNTWQECLRVLKPGGHMLVFGGTRTFHRVAVAIEDAGFELRESSIAWIYSQGFPKGIDVSKAIDRAAKVGGVLTAPATDAAKQWEGWNTSLKPAFEPIICARKPLSEGTVAANVLEHGTGALNIDAARIPTDDNRARPSRTPNDSRSNPEGRWPANVVFDDAMAGVLDEQTGVLTSGKLLPRHADHGKAAGTYGVMHGRAGRESYGDSGGASRFFKVIPDDEPPFRYCAKAPAKERPSYVTDDGRKISHSTVKPLALLRWLVRLVTQPDGHILDPFAGSGPTLEAAMLEGFHSTGIDNEPDYLPLIRQRIERNAHGLG